MTSPVDPCPHVCVRCAGCPDCCLCTTGELLVTEGLISHPDPWAGVRFQRLSLTEPDEVVAEQIPRYDPLKWTDLTGGKVADEPA